MVLTDFFVYPYFIVRRRVCWDCKYEDGPGWSLAMNILSFHAIWGGYEQLWSCWWTTREWAEQCTADVHVASFCLCLVIFGTDPHYPYKTMPPLWLFSIGDTSSHFNRGSSCFFRTKNPQRPSELQIKLQRRLFSSLHAFLGEQVERQKFEKTTERVTKKGEHQSGIIEVPSPFESITFTWCGGQA